MNGDPAGVNPGVGVSCVKLLVDCQVMIIVGDADEGSLDDELFPLSVEPAKGFPVGVNIPVSSCCVDGAETRLEFSVEGMSEKLPNSGVVRSNGF